MKKIILYSLLAMGVHSLSAQQVIVSQKPTVARSTTFKNPNEIKRQEKLRQPNGVFPLKAVAQTLTGSVSSKATRKQSYLTTK
ncbi:MAG: hypothetical protein IT223_08540 [Crocinitomicaceae bacterium]|nr:hypothetical protein [Crocinitomicaceae bacterium]